MYIAFEGIPGSGKAALAQRVASRLTRAGHRVLHARVSPHAASVSSRIDQVERQTATLGLHPRAWLFLALARETQQREDVVLPALRSGQVCLTEGALFSQGAIAEAWGLDAKGLHASLTLAEGPVQPDLLVLLDADPELAAFRKRAECESPPHPWSEGVWARARRSLLGMAGRDRARWLVIENEGRPLHVLEGRIAEAILARLERRHVQVEPLLPALPPAAIVRTAERLEEAFCHRLDDLETREPALCALLLEGIGGLAATRRRLHLLEHWPKQVARSLAGVVDVESQRLREVLLGLAPQEVALGLAGAVGPWADRLRERLFDVATREVVAGLARDEREQAWALRERALAQGFEAQVLRGLAGLDGARAWRVRSAALSPGWLGPLAESLEGLTGVGADALRERLLQDVPLAVLGSLRGLDSENAARLRERLVERAPGAVLRSLAGVESAAAFALRERTAHDCPEAIESLHALTSDAAWRLRERHLTTWPAAAVGSLGKLARSARGVALIERALAFAGERLGVLRSAYAAWMCETPERPIAPPAPSSDGVVDRSG